MHFVYFFGACVLAIVVFTVLYNIYDDRRLIKFSGLSESEFVQYFSEREVPSAVSQMVYRVFQKKVHVPNFTPSPDMSFDEVFKEDPEDVDDDGRYILKQLNIPEVPEDVRESWSGGELKTLGDLTMWVSWMFVRCSHSAPSQTQSVRPVEDSGQSET